MQLQKKVIIPFLVSAFLIIAFGSPRYAHAEATITVVNLDGSGEGFNDTSPPDADSTTGGNTGATLGAQRLIAFQFAADIWGSILESGVEIRVGANFDPLSCNETSAVLGEAGTNTVHRNFVGAPVANTSYPAALANSLMGSDLNPSSDDIGATFNSSVGTTCPFQKVWYYGLDGNPPAGTIDFVTVVLHELGHGLGFQTFVTLSTGAKLFGYDDTFMLNLEDHSTSKLYPDMTNTERVTASTNTGNLHWVGSNVIAEAGGHVEMYAPATQKPESSVSHFSTSLSPNELMEPSYTGPNHDLGLADALMVDIGWKRPCDLIVPTVTVSDSSLTPSQSFTINATVQNQGNGSSSSTTLRYFLSPDSTISTSDTQIGTDAVSALSTSGTSAESTSVTAPSSAGTYWIGACVDSVTGETDSGNNCSIGVQITVSDVLPIIKELREDFESWPPEGWIIINNSGDCIWERNETTGRTNYAGGRGYCAGADSDACGSNTTMDTELRTPVLNFAGRTSATLSYISSYNYLGGPEYANVDISTDGGTSWVNLLNWQADHHAFGPGETVNLDLTPYVGSSNVIIRFHYYAPGWYWWWEIDEVVIQTIGIKGMPWIPLLLLDD